MLNIAICDDDESSVTRLAEIVEQYTRQNNLSIEVNTFSSGIALLEKFNSYDLIFLDIDMPEMNGLDVGLKIKDENSKCEIIYVTNYADYAYRSFAIRPFGFVAKPFSGEDIFKELNDFIRKSNQQKEIHRICLSDGKITLNLDVENILYFEYSADKHIKVVTINEKYDMHGTLKYYFEKTQRYGFTYSHKSFVVNMLYITQIDRFDIVMKNNDRIPIAQKKKAQFMEEYNLFIQKKLGEVGELRGK